MVTKRLDDLGDRMKAYERIETSHKFRPNSWLYIRIDGRSFSKFTKGLARPYDERLSQLMVETAKFITKEFNCTIGYTQSDEMSFVIHNGYEDGIAIFEAKKQKLVSLMAAAASAFFNKNLAHYIPEKSDCVPMFDCRIFEVPSEIEAMNALYWRELDCIKNSISMSAHHYFSHKELHKKNSKDMKDMLLNCKGVAWDEYPAFFKFGTYVKRKEYMKDITIRTKVDELPQWIHTFSETPDRVEFVVSPKIILDTVE